MLLVRFYLFTKQVFRSLLRNQVLKQEKFLRVSQSEQGLDTLTQILTVKGKKSKEYNLGRGSLPWITFSLFRFAYIQNFRLLPSFKTSMSQEFRAFTCFPCLIVSRCCCFHTLTGTIMPRESLIMSGPMQGAHLLLESNFY